MSIENETTPKPSFGRRLYLAFKRLFIFLFRVLLTLLILGAIGAAIYLGAPVVIDEYLLKDVKVHSAQIQEINTELDANTEFLNQRLADLQNRLETLEIQSDTDKQTINDLKAQLTVAEGAIQDQTVSIENLETLQSSLDDYSVSLSNLEEQISTFEGYLEDIQANIATLDQSIGENQSELEKLTAQLEAQAEIGTLRQELELLKVMELVTRARVSIGQENIGLAKDDLQAAQDLLASLSSELPAYQAQYLSDIAQRLALAFENLDRATNLVDEDLEVAWQLLLQKLPEEPPGSDQPEGVEPTPTPQP